jgi:hypothetical protein
MPRRLLTLQPDGSHWLLSNGERTRCRVASDGLEAVLGPRRHLILGAGEWRVRWPELDNPVHVRVELEVPDPPDLDAWPLLADSTDQLGHPRQLAMTLAAGDDLAQVLTALPRYRLAVLFRHVLEGRAAPDPFFPPAVGEAGCTMQVLKNLLRHEVPTQPPTWSPTDQLRLARLLPGAHDGSHPSRPPPPPSARRVT